MTEEATLYERLGGREAIAAVVEEFYDRVLADEDLAPFFEDVDMDRLREHQREFVGYVTDGPDEYAGAGMDEAHAHLAITDEAFDGVVEHLDASLRACGVSDADREALLEQVAPLRDEIVTA